MILRLPIPPAIGSGKYLTADEIKQVNEWCARLAQLQLLGALLEDETSSVTAQKTGVTIKSMVDPVPVAFKEPPAIKCECGNDDIRKFSHVIYERCIRDVHGFGKDGSLGVGDDCEYYSVTDNDIVEVARTVAGEWLKCDPCQREQPLPTNVKIDW